MKRKLAISLAAALALAATTFGSAAAGRSTTNVIASTKKIGAFPVGANYARARRVFGVQYSSEQSSSTCTASWTNGVTISWQRSLPSTNWKKVCVKFTSARIGKAKSPGPAWRTTKGLRVGAATSKIKSLYPSAHKKRSGAYTVWTLQKTAKTSLQAWGKKGKIAYFRVAKH